MNKLNNKLNEYKYIGYTSDAEGVSYLYEDNEGWLASINTKLHETNINGIIFMDETFDGVEFESRDVA